MSKYIEQNNDVKILRSIKEELKSNRKWKLLVDITLVSMFCFHVAEFGILIYCVGKILEIIGG